MKALGLETFEKDDKFVIKDQLNNEYHFDRRLAFELMKELKAFVV